MLSFGIVVNACVVHCDKLHLIMVVVECATKYGEYAHKQKWSFGGRMVAFQHGDMMYVSRERG